LRLFVASDLHSYFTPFHNTLISKGFEENNPDHLLIICGDVFDRGGESAEVLEYLNNLTNVVLIRGNHEDLMEKMLKRERTSNVDAHNGTLRTFHDLLYAHSHLMKGQSMFEVVRELLTPFFSKFVDYFETKNFIFVHGWIPMKYDPNKPFAEYGDPTLFDENWRDGDWAEARWFNGIKMAHNGIIVKGKTIVCGHWHCSYGWHKNSLKTDHHISEFGSSAIWEPYYEPGVCAIDRCTAHTNECNVLVLEDELLEEKDNKET
jgi:hypothetical protein